MAYLAQLDDLTIAFLVIISVVFFTSLLLYYSKKCADFVSYAPALMTGLGMLGTFVGIVTGLWNFQTDNMDNSIVGLLSGIKTAFTTSVCGLSATLIFKTITTLFTVREGNTSEDAGAPEIINAVKNQSEKTHKLLLHLIKRISTNKEKSLQSQLKLMQDELLNIQRQSSMQLKSAITELSNNQRQTLEQSKTFYDELLNHQSETKTMLEEKLSHVEELLSKSVTEIVIEALKETITDFNNNLTEQFGDNFKALNQSVEKLVIWQDNYAKQIQQMTELFDKSSNSIGKIDESMSSIQQSTDKIPDTMSSLKSVIETNHHQIQELQRHLEAFSTLKESATQALPETKEYIENIVKDIEDLQKEVTNKIQGTLESTLREAGEVLKEEIRQYNEIMGENTENNLQELANALAGITGKFTEDYQKLVNEMNQIIRTR